MLLPYMMAIEVDQLLLPLTLKRLLSLFQQLETGNDPYAEIIDTIVHWNLVWGQSL
jgi:hypothetical protein